MCVVAALVGTRVIVELQDDVVFKGVLELVDPMMKYGVGLSLLSLGVKQSYEGPVFLKGRKVRYIHIPKSLDMVAAVEKQRKPAQMRRKFTPAGTGTSGGTEAAHTSADDK
eukprot:jgi/Mesvir1/24898/Mv22120-RA.1